MQYCEKRHRSSGEQKFRLGPTTNLVPRMGTKVLDNYFDFLRNFVIMELHETRANLTRVAKARQLRRQPHIRNHNEYDQIIQAINPAVEYCLRQ